MTRLSEPRPEGDEWVEWGAEPVWAVGFTAGGCPYGLTLEASREVAMESRPHAGWAQAMRALERVARKQAGPGPSIEVGRVKYVGKGLYRQAFAADVALHPDSGGLSGFHIALVAKHETEPEYDDRARREAALLAELAPLELPLRVPNVLGSCDVAGRPVIVETPVHGIPLDLRASRQPGVRPWEEVARVAAAVHAIDPRDLACSLPGHATRREHAEAEMTVFDGLDDPVARLARAWAAAHLPPSSPSSLLHGDLLGQNILLSPEPGEAPGVIDWEFATLGDPAYDLAIVTRGVRRPFHQAKGLSLLLRAYAAHGAELSRHEVTLHELCLAARWYRDSLDSATRVHPPEVTLQRLRSILGRAGR